MHRQRHEYRNFFVEYSVKQQAIKRKKKKKKKSCVYCKHFRKQRISRSDLYLFIHFFIFFSMICYHYLLPA